MRSELSKTMAVLNKKAKSSASASREWDRRWAERKARYSRRVAAVRAHNSSERRRYAASETERANSDGELVVVRTYQTEILVVPYESDEAGAAGWGRRLRSRSTVDTPNEDRHP